MMKLYATDVRNRLLITLIGFSTVEAQEPRILDQTVTTHQEQVKDII